MIQNASISQLHDRATRGQSLTAGELSDLEAWYELQDEEEQKTLSTAAARPSDILSTLREETDAIISHLVITTQRIQTLNEENEVLRRDINELYRRLEQSAPPQAA